MNDSGLDWILTFCGILLGYFSIYYYRKKINKYSQVAPLLGVGLILLLLVFYFHSFEMDIYNFDNVKFILLLKATNPTLGAHRISLTMSYMSLATWFGCIIFITIKNIYNKIFKR